MITSMRASACGAGMLVAGAAPSSTRALSCQLATSALTDFSFSAATPVVASASLSRWSFRPRNLGIERRERGLRFLRPRHLQEAGQVRARVAIGRPGAARIVDAGDRLAGDEVHLIAHAVEIVEHEQALPGADGDDQREGENHPLQEWT